jgi:hypothetical protein
MSFKDIYKKSCRSGTGEEANHLNTRKNKHRTSVYKRNKLVTAAPQEIHQ